jgi:hypothetical protein
LDNRAPLGAGYFCAPGLLLAKSGFGGLNNKITQVTPEALEGKPRAKTGRNTQTNNTSDHQYYKLVKLIKVSDLAPNAALWHVLQVELRALGSKSIRLHLGHLNPVEKK